MLFKKIIGFSVAIFLSINLFSFTNVIAQTEEKLPEIHFFYSLSCVNCQKQEKFLDDLQYKYPDLKIERHEVGDPTSDEILKDFAKRYDAATYQGLVPITFIGNRFVVGYKDDETTGQKIEKMLFDQNEESAFTGSVCDQNSDLESCQIVLDLDSTSKYEIIDSESKLSLFGLSAKDLSLPILSILLGFFDGFNVCSLGALILILSLVFTFKSRRKIFIFGGTFLIITGITYSLLIVFWSKIFSFISPYIHAFEIVIGLIGLIGGIYFFNQFFKFRKYGPQCETISNPILKKAVLKLQEIFKNQKNIWVIFGFIILFAFLVTIIEFPCSAVIPVAFSAILAGAEITSGAYWLYIILFMLFYMLDEIVVFLIATWTMKIWINSSKMTTWIVLIQAIVFISLGVFYLGKIFF